MDTHHLVLIQTIYFSNFSLCIFIFIFNVMQTGKDIIKLIKNIKYDKSYSL